MFNRRMTLIVALCALVMTLGAEQALAQAADATGTWKWTQTFGGRRGGGGGGGAATGGAATQPATQPGGGGARAGGRGFGQPREITLNLKQDGEKLTGQIIGLNFQDPTAAFEIKEGSVKNGEVTFKVTRTFADQEFTTSYKARLDGDTLKGTSETSFNGNVNPIEFEAKRQKAS